MTSLCVSFDMRAGDERPNRLLHREQRRVCSELREGRSVSTPLFPSNHSSPCRRAAQFALLLFRDKSETVLCMARVCRGYRYAKTDCKIKFIKNSTLQYSILMITVHPEWRSSLQHLYTVHHTDRNVYLTPLNRSSVFYHHINRM